MGALEQFSASLGDKNGVLESVRRYVSWRSDRGLGSDPTRDDDVDIRTFLAQLRIQGIDAQSLQHVTRALEAFYTWAKKSDFIESNPFEEYNFDRPYLSRDQIRRRKSALDPDHDAHELAHLRGLNQLAEALNRAVDVQSALDATLHTLVETIDLQTAWAFIHCSSGLLPAGVADDAPHNFTLAASCGLPPGLAREDRYFLRKPPTCHCQSLLQVGHLQRAINIVECSRLQSSAEADGDNQGLMFHASAPILARNRVMGMINVATKDWQFLSGADLAFLSSAGALVAVALERAHLFDLAEAQRRRLAHELDMARTVQASLLPQRLPDIPGFQLAATWRSAHQVAGDFYDLFELPDQRWAVVVGDVTDKGAPAALYMAVVRSLVRGAGPAAADPARLLEAVNRELQQYASTGMFVTACCVFIDSAASTLTYANAGHNPPYLAHATGPLETLPPTGPLLGVMQEVKLSTRTLTMASGDRLVIYTDGLTDAIGTSGRPFDLPKAIGACMQAPNTEAFLGYIMTRLEDFKANAPQDDDITVVVLAKT